MEKYSIYAVDRLCEQGIVIDGSVLSTGRDCPHGCVFVWRHRMAEEAQAQSRKREKRPKQLTKQSKEMLTRMFMSPLEFCHGKKIPLKDVSAIFSDAIARVGMKVLAEKEMLASKKKVTQSRPRSARGKDQLGKAQSEEVREPVGATS